MKANIVERLLILAGLLAAAGCTGAPTQTSLTSPTPSRASAPVPPTPNPYPPPTQASVATETRAAAGYPAPQASRLPTSTPGPRQSATATFAPGQAIQGQTGNFSSGRSTNGAWFWAIEPGPQGFLVTHFRSADAGQDWRVQFEPRDFAQKTVEELYLVPVFWLPKEPYVFLAGMYKGGCGWEAFSLRRLNLKTGLLTSLIPGAVCSPMAISFSHTGRYLLHAYPGQAQLQLQRLSDGSAALINLPVPNTFVAALSWSPDETRVVMETCRTARGEAQVCQSRPLVWLDAENDVPHRLLPDLNALKEGPNDTWSSVFWLSSNRISIHMQSGIAWEVSLVSGLAVCRGADGFTCPARKGGTGANP